MLSDNQRAPGFVVKVDKGLIRIPLLLERLELEAQLRISLLKLANVVLVVLLLVGALSSFQASGELSQVQNHLRSHFSLDHVSDIQNFEQLYSFVETFERRNSELQASSANYWCERRFFQFGWDADLDLPTSGCPSPRQQALGAEHMASAVGPPAAAAGSIECADSDGALQHHTGNPSDTCAVATDAPESCLRDYVARFCPGSCGFCAPFEYDPWRRFSGTQLALGPVVVYQRRWQSAACGGFAESYNDRLAPSSIEGEGSHLACPGRGEELDSADHAHEVPCVQGCDGPWMLISARHEFQGEAVYPELLLLKTDSARMRNVQWLDGLTESVTVATIVYTANVEVFTRLAVEFGVNKAGGFEVDVQTSSYKEMSFSGGAEADASTFYGFSVSGIIMILVGLIGRACHLYVEPRLRSSLPHVLDVTMMGGLLVFTLVLVGTWSAQDWMKDHCTSLLNAVIGMQSGEESERAMVIEEFLSVSQEIAGVHAAIRACKYISYFVLHLAFLQALFHFKAHPKLGVLMDTVVAALDDLQNFAILFVAVFLLMAFLAHWTFGAYVFEYGTYSAALSTQWRKLFGEILVETGAVEDLPDARLFLYQVYVTVFLLGVFWTALATLLAIMVEVFPRLRRAGQSQKHVNNFVVDFVDTCAMLLVYPKNAWPTRAKLGNALRDEGELELAAFQEHFPKHGIQVVLDYLETYDRKCSGELVFIPPRHYHPPPRSRPKDAGVLRALEANGPSGQKGAGPSDPPPEHFDIVLDKRGQSLGCTFRAGLTHTCVLIQDIFLDEDEAISDPSRQPGALGDHNLDQAHAEMWGAVVLPGMRIVAVNGVEGPGSVHQWTEMWRQGSPGNEVLRMRIRRQTVEPGETVPTEVITALLSLENLVKNRPPLRFAPAIAKWVEKGRQRAIAERVEEAVHRRVQQAKDHPAPDWEAVAAELACAVAREVEQAYSHFVVPALPADQAPPARDSFQAAGALSIGAASAPVDATPWRHFGDMRGLAPESASHVTAASESAMRGLAQPSVSPRPPWVSPEPPRPPSAPEPPSGPTTTLPNTVPDDDIDSDNESV